MNTRYTYLVFASLARPPAHHRRWRAFVCRPSGRPASWGTLPPPQRNAPRSRLSNPGRLSRPGGRHRFRQSSSPPVQARRFVATFPVSSPPSVHPCPENGSSQLFLPIIRRQPDRHRPAPNRITPLLVATPTNYNKKPPPRLKYQSRSRPDRRHASFRQTPRRRISDNAIYV